MTPSSGGTTTSAPIGIRRPRTSRAGSSVKGRMSQTILFDRHDVERLESLDERPRRLSGTKLLWVDLDRISRRDATEVAEAFDLDDDDARYLRARTSERAVFGDHGRYIHVTTYAPREDEEGELHAVECVVGENWVDHRPRPADPGARGVRRRGSRARATPARSTARASSPPCSSGCSASYTAAFERIEQQLEEFDVQAMRGEGSDEDIETLVDMRREARQAPPRARRAPVAARRPHPSRARGARQPRVRRALPVAASHASRPRCRRHGTRGR